MNNEFALTKYTKALWQDRWKRMRHISFPHWSEWPDNQEHSNVRPKVDRHAASKRLDHFRNFRKEQANVP